MRRDKILYLISFRFPECLRFISPYSHVFIYFLLKRLGLKTFNVVCLRTGFCMKTSFLRKDCWKFKGIYSRKKVHWDIV